MPTSNETIPKFFSSYSVKVQGKPGEVYTLEGGIPEELMDIYKKIVGDGLAKVSVGMDISMKDYGSGGSAMVSVTLTCGQSEEEIREAQDIARSLVSEFAYKNALAARELYQGMLQQANQGKPNYK